MPNASESWLRAYEARGYHKQAIHAIADADASALESDLHDDIIKFLRARDLPYYHSRMDRKTTGNLGAPDFFIFLDKGKTLHVECKRKSNKESPDQLAYHAWLAKRGHTVYVVHNMQEFIASYESCLGEAHETD